MPDVVDQGQELAAVFVNTALANHKKRTRQKPKLTPFEVDGERFCLECADDISPERIAACDAVHCLQCEERLQRSEQHGR
jgi:RNA polymerase-binding transcription factor DksA